MLPELLATNSDLHTRMAVLIAPRLVHGTVYILHTRDRNEVMNCNTVDELKSLRLIAIVEKMKVKLILHKTLRVLLKLDCEF